MLVTHISFAFLLGLLMIRYLPVSVNNYLLLAVIVLSCILPDIDCKYSLIGKRLRPLSLLFKHRGFFHSIILAVILSIILFIFTRNSYYALAVIVGFVSHLFLDSLTKSGTTPFWPSKMRIKGRLRTGRLVDWILLIIFLGLSYVLLSS